MNEKAKEEKEERAALRVGSQGRVIIPPSVLTKKGIKEGDIVWVSVEKAQIASPEKGKGR